MSSQLSIYNPDTLSLFEKIANIMAKTSLVPSCLHGKPFDCFMVVQQAHRWGMDPFAVAGNISVIRGKLCYEGKLISAVLEALTGIQLNYEFSGSGEARSVHVTGKRSGDPHPVGVVINLKDVKTDNLQWRVNSDQMLSYRGARDWARRYASATMLGVYSIDEMEASELINVAAAKASVSQPTLPQEAIIITQGVHEDVKVVDVDDDDNVVVIDLGSEEQQVLANDIINAYSTAKTQEEFDSITDMNKDLIKSMPDAVKKYVTVAYKEAKARIK